MPNNHFLLAVSVLTLAAGSALAEGANINDPSKLCSPGQSEAQQLQCWKDQYNLQTAELQALQTAKKVDGETGESMLSDQARQLTVPNVQLIYGTSIKGMKAVLIYSDGRSLTVSTGEKIPGNFTVQTISSSPPSVVLNHAGDPLVLLMGGNGSSLQSTPNANDQTAGQVSPVPGTIVGPPVGLPGPGGVVGN